MEIEGAKTLIADSGNGFHCRAAQFFRQKQWAVLMSPYYIDASTDRARELDLIVEKSIEVPKLFGGSRRRIRLRLFIECKYIAQGAVFWFDLADKARTRALIESSTPFRSQLPTRFDKQHYQAQGDQVAKLYASEGKKAEENDPIFRAINQCLNGYISNRDRANLEADWRDEEKVQLRYPVIMCSSFANFFRTNVRSAEDPVAIMEDFMLEMDYAFIHPHSGNTTREYFLIDFVNFERPEAFIARLEREVESASFMAQDG